MRIIRLSLCFIALLTVNTLIAQRTITGNITDGIEPLIGATVLVKGTNEGTVTDFEGNYSVVVPDGSNTLVFSYTGFSTQEIELGASDVVDIRLTEGVALDEVVVVGYGEQTRAKMVQSIATVSNDKFRDIVATSPQELLQGQASGVQVVSASGILGSAPIVKIRGINSLTSGGRPLVVVDGVPLNDAVYTEGQGGIGLNPLGDLNVNDIETFSILKDAAATAIYGSRGANGVILIKTKSGKLNQKTRVTLNASTSISEATDLIDMMNADQFRDFRVRRGDAASAADFPQGGFDWADNVVRTGNGYNLDAGVTGGSDKSTFFIGLNYSDQEGFIVGNNLERIGGRLNLTHRVGKRLKVGMNLGITNTINDRVGAENSTFAPLTSAYLQLPYVQPRDENGNFVNTGFIANVLAIEEFDRNELRTLRTLGNAFAEVSIFEGLKFKTDFGFDNIDALADQRSVEVNSPGGNVEHDQDKISRFVATNTLNYTTSFGESDINVVGGMSYEQTTWRESDLFVTGFLSDDQQSSVSGAEVGTGQNELSEYALVGYFARATYDFKNKYLFEASFRRDGSSRFGRNARYGNFFAVGGAWVISQEEFFNSNVFNFLKLRANFGTVGNDRIGASGDLEGNANNYASFEDFGGGVVANYNGAAGLRQLAAGNPDLQWETSRSFTIGFETSLLDERILLNVDYYRRNSEDLVLDNPIPFTNGGLNSITRNVGELRNTGLDIDLTVEPVRTNDFSWSANFNVGFNDNEVISLPGAGVDIEGRQFITGDNSTVQRAIVGESATSFYLIRYQGVNPQTGDAEWLDRNGNVTTTPTDADRVIAGDANPDFTGGFRNTLRYKNLDLTAFFNFSVGNDIYISGLRFTDNPTGNFNKSVRVADVWEQAGDDAYVPSFDSPTFGTFRQHSTLFLKDGSFARLRNLTLGYNLDDAVLRNIGIAGARFYVTGNNLFTIKSDELEGIDPEVTDTIDNVGQGVTFFTPPQFRSFVFGINVTF